MCVWLSESPRGQREEEKNAEEEEGEQERETEEVEGSEGEKLRSWVAGGPRSPGTEKLIN